MFKITYKDDWTTKRRSTAYAEDAKRKQFDKAQQEKQEMQRELEDLRRRVQVYEKSKTNTEKLIQENKALQKELNECKKRCKTMALKQMRFSGVTSENLNDPYRETELVKMYDNLKQSWLVLRQKALQSRKRTSEEINILGAQILQCKYNKQILQKQLIFRGRSSYQDELKIICIGHNLQNPGDSCFQDFVAECFKVASLMFLHDPALSPNWNIPRQKDRMIFPAITNGCSELYPAEIVSYSLDKK
ncbi:uncharacterized protein LOC114663628 isoform X3 [Erpetoichthys calabaricus]|uniref:uncharacterized protein LOC114663628 isoform X3 n=1 Tax=Erpetoichthys calabaricus TaxID=27687 RepID=UPI0022346BC2|nr:uncharacterized protein LOC114663628 isoform X3 [Erpetoichthys calabaricus]